MHPSSGETPARAQIPQNANKSAMEIMSLLSVERFFGIRHLIKNPNVPPRISAARFIPMGLSTFAKPNEPDERASATEIAIL